MQYEKDADFINELIEFYKGGEPVVDATYGAGRFWSKARPDSLITIDIDPDSEVDLHIDHRKMDQHLEAGSIGTIIYDPPHVKRNVKKSDVRQSVQAMYNLPTWDGDFEPFLRAAMVVLRPGGVVIAKVGDEVSRPPWNDVRFLNTAAEVGFVPFDRIVKFRHPSIRNPAQKQHRARKRHCFFIILTKGECG